MIKSKYEYGDEIIFGGQKIHPIKTECKHKPGVKIGSATYTDDCIFFISKNKKEQYIVCNPDDVIVVR